MRITLKQHVVEGGCLPRGYGVVWLDYGGAEYFCLPIPFNLFVRALREIWWAVRFPPRLTAQERREAEIYQRGVREGWERQRQRAEWEETGRLRAEALGHREPEAWCSPEGLLRLPARVREELEIQGPGRVVYFMASPPGKWEMWTSKDLEEYFRPGEEEI